MIFMTELRKRKKITQVQLAEKLGVTQGAVSQWEKGLSFPDVRLLVKLSEILECTVDELLKGGPNEREGTGIAQNL